MRNQILVIEDDQACFDILSQVLSDYDTFPMRTGALAMTVIETKRPDLVLLDLNLPDMGGLQILEQLRSHPDESIRQTPVIVLTADTDEDSIAECFEMGASGHVTKPIQPQVVVAQVKAQLKLLKYSTKMSFAVEEQSEKLRSIYTSMINIFSLLVGQRDGSTGDHIANVTRYMGVIIRHLDNGGRKWFPEDDVEYVVALSALHDIGKISISDTILQKEAKLTDEEYEIMQQHPLKGGAILRASQDMLTNGFAEKMQYGIDMAECHHERWDGSGYPHRLKGEDIPYAARVLHLCDVYEAITAKRWYKPAFTHIEAFDKIVNGDDKTKPQHFDPHVLRAFIRAEKEFAQILGSTKSPAPFDHFIVRGKDRRRGV